MEIVCIILQTVIETPEFIKQAKRCLDENSKANFIDFIARNPLAGDIIQSTGGARKIRWQSDLQTGKRGGARIIYYYHNENMPIYLFTAYKKNERADISASDKKILQQIIKAIVNEYRGSRL